MRIYPDDSGDYLQSLASLLATHPSMLESWRCLHMQWTPPCKAGREQLVSALTTAYGTAGCDVVFCGDDGMLVIGPSPDINILYQLQATLGGSNEKHEAQRYELISSWREIRAILCPDAPSATNILMVEQHQKTCGTIQTLLKSEYHVLTANNAHEALYHYLLHAPVMVFLDIHFPCTNSLQLLKQLLANDSEASVLVFSGNNHIDHVMHTLNAGMNISERNTGRAARH